MKERESLQDEQRVIEALEKYLGARSTKWTESVISSRVPDLAKDPRFLALQRELVVQLPTQHFLRRGDARQLAFIPEDSVHLIVTSPPYWSLKRYEDNPDQLGHIEGYEEFLAELTDVLMECYHKLRIGGRLVCVVGDVCLSRRKNNGRHVVVPLHASILEIGRRIGFDPLAPIIWYKISNASYEMAGSSGFLGKPYEPNAVVKNDFEFVLSLRKPGGYRRPSFAKRLLSIIHEEEYSRSFKQIWSDIPGASTRHHPAPYPEALASRIIRMFSFVDDTVLDPFVGTGTTMLAAANSGRNSIGSDIEFSYLRYAASRLDNELRSLVRNANCTIELDSNGAENELEIRRTGSNGS